MKYFLAASVLWTVSASANPVCSTIWVYKPWKTCAHAANGLDTSATPVNAGQVDLKSEWVGGGADQQKICSDLEGSFNRQNNGNGQVGRLTKSTPVWEERRDNNRVYVQYKYTCRIAVSQYPPLKKAAAVCGEEENYTYKTGGTSAGIQGDAECLSCDMYNDPGSKSDCLKWMIENILDKKVQGVDVRESDTKAVSKAVKEILDMAKSIKIEGVSNNIKTFGLFTRFVEANPAQ